MIKTIYDIPEHIFKTSYQNATIGHVLTPPKLALEMIETLPSDFIKSGIKILDPACKNGSFIFQLVIKQLDNGWLIKDIEKSLYTCDTLIASLNIAESGIKHIIRFPYQNSLIKINNLLYKYPSIEILYDELIKTITKNKYISIRQFINELLLDRKNNWLIVKFEENLIEFIKKYEGLSKTESKLFGEVFTPQTLIEEMLDTLPDDVWSNKDLKWLDPAVGIGNFPAAILNRLMKGLGEVIVDSDERKKHILENMLYMGDISTKNLFLLYQLFDANNEFKLNVFRGDFLSDKFDKQMIEWGLDGFDLVVGNPPYQKGIHIKFFNKSFDLLKNDKYLLFIHPSTPFINRKPSREDEKTTKIKQIIEKYDSFLTLVDGNIFFDAGFFTPLSITYVKKTEYEKIRMVYSHIDFNNKNIKIYDNLSYINIHGDDIVNNISKKIKSKMVFSIEDKLYRNANISPINKYFKICRISGHPPKKNENMINPDFFQLVYKESETDVSKLITNNPIGRRDDNNQFNELVIINENEISNIHKYLMTKFARFCLSIYKNSANILSDLKIVPYMNFDVNWTDEKLFEYFEITNEEKEFILKYIPDWYQLDYDVSGKIQTTKSKKKSSKK